VNIGDVVKLRVIRVDNLGRVNLSSARPRAIPVGFTGGRRRAHGSSDHGGRGGGSGFGGGGGVAARAVAWRRLLVATDAAR
jgi:hypothetical protein